MARQVILLGLFVIFALSGISHFWLFDDYVKRDSELTGHFSIWNDDDKELKDITLTFEVLGAGDFLQLAKVDIQPRTYYGQYIFYDVPSYLPKGDYLAKMTASSKRGKRLYDTQYEYFTVI